MDDRYVYNPETDEIRYQQRNGEWRTYEGRRFRSPQTGAVGVYERGTFRLIYDPRAGENQEQTARQGDNLWAAAGSGAVRGITSVPQMPLAAINLVARADPRRYEGGQYALPGSGTYDAPAPTYEEWLSGAANISRDAGVPVIADVIEREPLSSAEAVTRSTFEAGSQGLSAGGAPRAIRSAVRGRLTPIQLRMAGGEALREGGAGAIAGLTGSAVGEVFGPTAGAIAGIIGGTVSGRTMFAPSRADEMIRRNAENLTQQDFDNARALMAAARAQGIDITTAEAIAAVSTGGSDLASLAVDVSTLRQGASRFTPVQRARLERFDTRLNEILDELRGPTTARTPEMTGAILQQAARDYQNRARSTVRQAVDPFYERLKGVEYPAENVEALHTRLQRAKTENFQPGDAGWIQIENLQNGLFARDPRGRPLNGQDGRELRYRTDVRHLDSWLAGYDDFANNRTETPISTRVLANINPAVRAFETSLVNNVPELSRARRETRELSRIIIDPYRRALAGISDPEQAQDAGQLFRYIAGYSTSGNTRIDPGTVRRGYRALYQQDPRAAVDALSYHIRNVFDQAYSDTIQGSPRVTAPAVFRQRLFGNSTNRANIKTMFDEIDRQRGLPVGTSFSALENFLDISAATGQLPGVGSPTAGRAGVQAQAREGRVMAGALAQTAVGGIAAPTNAIGRWMANTIEYATYDRIAELFASTDPATIDNIMRLARADSHSPEALIFAAQLVGYQQGVNAPPNQEQ